MGDLLSLNKGICFQIWSTGDQDLITKFSGTFFGTSHEKGIVTCIGGSVKGSVHQKILTGKVIYTAEEVAQVARGCHTNILIIFICSGNIEHSMWLKYIIIYIYIYIYIIR